MTNARLLRGIRFGTAFTLAAIATFWLWSNRDTYGGDPEIHLVFAEHLVRGYPLQFNKGIYSSGETSPAYMALLALVMSIVGPARTAVFSKLFGVASALALLKVVHTECRQSGLTSYESFILIAGLAAAPFFFFQASLGMENMPFALMVALLLRASLSRNERVRGRLLLALAAHALFFWRPEAILLVAYIYVTWLSGKSKSYVELFALAMMSIAIASIVMWVERRTGVPLQGAGRTRALMSRFESVQLSSLPLYINPKPFRFLLYTWPLWVALWYGRRYLDRQRVIMLSVLVLIPLLLHLGNYFPNTHFSRYSLYFWPAMFTAAIRPVAKLAAVQDMSGSTTMSQLRSFVRRHAISILVGNLAVVAIAEGASRYRIGAAWNDYLSLSQSLSARNAVKERSDALCAVVGCSNGPVVVAVQEVQQRRQLDDRFIVRSLDGVVDVDFAPYITSAGIDYLAYIREKDVDVILEFPPFSVVPDGTRDSLPNVFDEALANGYADRGCDRYRIARLGGWFSSPFLIRARAPSCEGEHGRSGRYVSR